ncbi:MAG: alpha/beta hydrolase [Oscillospiraceae bacterium]|nr:alpha/beta hydrolase [Oscillospiraceae bacterium]
MSNRKSLISNEAAQMFGILQSYRMDRVDYDHYDFKSATKANTESINAISNLSDCDITWVDADGVPAEKILIPGADPNQYIYYIHGGGWTNGEPEWGHFCAVEIAKKSGRNLISVHYRYAPEYAYPTSHEDCFTVYNWMLKQGIASENIVFLGESTGGNLVFSTAVIAKREHAPLPAAICSISPVMDLSFSFPSYTERMDREVILPRNQKEIVQALYVKGADTKDPVMSPYYADFTGFPPVYLEVSTEEMLFDDSIRTHEKLLRQGVDSRLKVWEGMWHTFYQIDLPESRQAFKNIASFFRETAK